MDMQNVSNLRIDEGDVGTIHDNRRRLLWGAVRYNTSYYGGLSIQGTPTPSSPIWPKTVGGQQLITITGKNLFNESSITSGTQSGVTFNNNSGVFSIKGTATAAIDRAGFVPIDNAPASLIKAGNTYTLSTNKPLPAGTYVSVLLYSASSWAADVVVLYGDGSTTSATKVATVPSTATRARYLFHLNSGATIDLSDLSFQLEIGSSATVHEEYLAHQYTVSLGSTELLELNGKKDYIYKSGGSWYIHRENSVNTPDLSESQVRDYANASYCTFRKPTDYSEYGTYLYDGHMLCSHAVVGASPSGGWNNANGIGKAWLGAEKTNVWVGFAPGTTLADMKAALSGVKMYYPVKTPTNIEITNAGLISQLNSVDQFLTRIPYNYSVSGDLPTEIARAGI